MKDITLTKKTRIILLDKFLIPKWFEVFNIDIELGKNILSESLDLINQDSTDSRFENALEDFHQHMVNNNDWDIEYLFKDRFPIYEDDQKIISFLLKILNGRVFISQDDQLIFAQEIDNLLKIEKINLVTIGINEFGFNIFQLRKFINNVSFPFGIKVNDIPFFINSTFNRNHECFLLIPGTWDDYHTKSSFLLKYYDGLNLIEIGYLKIIHESTLITKEEIPIEFLELDSNFCSLGQDSQYYEKLLSIKGKQFFESVSYALKDVSLFSSIAERFETTKNFKNSLIRSDNAERLLRITRHKFLGSNSEDFYNFEYLYTPPYNKDYVIKVPFKFKSDAILNDRIIAIIGKNAVGKTNLLSKLPIDLSQHKKEFFNNSEIPSFSKIIAVSFSAFDNFIIPKKNDGFNYVYCGLKDTNEDELLDNKDRKSNKSLQLAFHFNIKNIIKNSRYNSWRKIVSFFIDDSILKLFAPNHTLTDESQYSASDFSNIRDQLSSGQAIMLFILTSIIANIRYDTLLIFDEPETHLHPNAIVSLMNLIYEITSEYQSFGIIATHSPFIIRELFSRNVWVLEREYDIPSLRRIGIESFGENISTISNEIFRDRETKKTYIEIINNLKKKNLSKDQIINFLKSDNLPLSLETSIQIEIAFKEK